MLQWVVVFVVFVVSVCQKIVVSVSFSLGFVDVEILVNFLADVVEALPVANPDEGDSVKEFDIVHVFQKQDSYGRVVDVGVGLAKFDPDFLEVLSDLLIVGFAVKDPFETLALTLSSVEVLLRVVVAEKRDIFD